MASTGNDAIETAALGRPFQLGMLYDCRKDALIPSVTLWDQDQLQKNTSVQRQSNTEVSVTTSDSIEEKSNSLNISGSLRLSLLGGLVNVDGSAKYFQDTKKSHKQARVTLQYRATTIFKTLSVSDLANGQVSHPNVFEDGIATHVVTAIWYGAGAYFVFDRKPSSEDDKKQVEREAGLISNKLKDLTANPEASLNLDEEEKAAFEKFSCTFYGDFKLLSNPVSFSDVVIAYRNLPNMLGEKGEHGVPLRVWLHPLVKLDSRAARLQRDISNDLIMRLSETVETLNQTGMRCSDILTVTAATTFPAMEKKVHGLMKVCHQYKLDFIQRLRSVLPSIRGGEKEESALEDILNAHNKSPFNSKDLDEWLKTKAKESDILKSFIKQLEKLGAKMDKNLDQLLCDIEVKNVVCFSFPSEEEHDSFLVKLSNHVKPEGVVDAPGESSDPQATNINWLSTGTRQALRKQLKLFEELKKLNNSDDTKFIVASKHDAGHPEAGIFIYEDGCDAVCFVPPSKPAPPKTTPLSSDSLTVWLSEPGSDTVNYRVEYKMKHDTEWRSHLLEQNQEAVTLLGLTPDTVYEIRATAVGKLSYTVSSDVCSAIILTTVGPPTLVKDVKVKTNSVTLTWSVPSVQRCEYVKGYIIEFKEKNSNQWQSKETGTEEYMFTLNDLKLNMVYSIRMRTDVGVGVSLPGEELEIKTKKHQVAKKDLTLISNDPPVYLLKLQPAGVGQFNKKVFGRPATKNPLNKTILVVGATGSGKTTLINGMINYVLGVDWEDNMRFKLINEETNETQACSQTSEVTAYQIHHKDGFQVPYSLTIIDTPGFGDTRGIKQDKLITGKIREFFSVKGGIDSIDAVCFVVQSALARLTHTQKYIFDAILSIFGTDIANSIIALVTFADGKSPPVLEGIKSAGIPCAKNIDGSTLHFKFNNSVLFAKNTGAKGDENNFDYMFWKMGKVSMKTFFTHLESMQPQSLTLTREVLEERRQLEVIVVGVQPMIRKGLSKLEEINTTKAALQNHETHIKENEDFEYEVVAEKSERINIKPGTFITNCHGCNYTCHYPCIISRDEKKIGCAAMKNGNCTVCPGKCVWSVHFNMTYRWDIKRVTEKRTYQDLKKKYEAALGGKMNSEKIIKQLQAEYEDVQLVVTEMIERLNKCLQRLKEIALRPDPLATPDYIDLLIQTEEQEGHPGFVQRIEELRNIRGQAVLLAKLANEHSTFKKKSPVKGVFNHICNWFKAL